MLTSKANMKKKIIIDKIGEEKGRRPYKLALNLCKVADCDTLYFVYIYRYKFVLFLKLLPFKLIGLKW